MKRLFIFLLTVICGSAQAQLSDPAYATWDGHFSVGTYGRYQLATNALTSNFVWNLYQGKNLSRDLRNKVSNKLGKSNRLGADLDYGLFAKHFPDSTSRAGIGWFMKIASRTHVNTKFPKDLFDISMFGNAMFAGKTADLSNIELRFMSYKQFEIGILKNITKKKGTWNLGLGVSLLMGNRNLNFSVDKAELFTEENGEYLEGEIQGSIRTSSLSASQYFDSNGIGFSTSLNVGYQSKKFGFLFQVADLGMISWSKQLTRTELDSSFLFEGVELDLFPSDGVSFSSINLDTVVAGFASKRTPSKYSMATPATFRLEGFYALNSKKWKLYAGVQYRIASAYVPYVYVGTSSPLPKGFFIDGRMAYGGFGSWNIGLEIRKKFAEVLEIRLGTNNLEGYVLPMVGTSQGAYLGITGFF
ncbi:MAG: hypothetical protein JKX84_03100 [Flavobacteriales bacterium]|nr:hypothetical protein [Flavobacteriales bacterium]